MKQISEAVGLLAAVVGTVYLLGALILALRLQTNDLPTLAVLSNLPRELVISVGLTYAVAPWLLAAAAVAIFWFVREQAPAAPASKRLVRPSEVARSAGLAAAGLLAAWLSVRELGGRFTWWDAVALGAAVVAVTLLANALWRLLSRRYGQAWSKPALVALASSLAGLVAVPVLVEVGARAPLAEAQLCGEGSTHLRGWLVGEANDRVYIGENVDPHRIVSAPRTGELYVGPEATESFLCRGERALRPTADQLVAAAFEAIACAKCAGRVTRLRVSGTQPWFASAIVGGYRADDEVVFRESLLFRRTEGDWRLVSVLSRAGEDCGGLEDRTGVSAEVLAADLGVCSEDR